MRWQKVPGIPKESRVRLPGRLSSRPGSGVEQSPPIIPPPLQRAGRSSTPGGNVPCRTHIPQPGLRWEYELLPTSTPSSPRELDGEAGKDRRVPPVPDGVEARRTHRNTPPAGLPRFPCPRRKPELVPPRNPDLR